MNLFARILRRYSRTRFRLKGLATIKDIPTDRLADIRKALVSDGWAEYYEYTGFDAWIDYGCIKLKNGRARLKLEWDNWSEGSLEGQRDTIEAIGKRFGFPVSNEWRWSEWDEDHGAT